MGPRKNSKNYRQVLKHRRLIPDRGSQDLQSLKSTGGTSKSKLSNFLLLTMLAFFFAFRYVFYDANDAECETSEARE